MIIGIIGAGIAGLTAGRYLAKQGHEITILEKSGERQGAYFWVLFMEQ